MRDGSCCLGRALPFAEAARFTLVCFFPPLQFEELAVESRQVVDLNFSLFLLSLVLREALCYDFGRGLVLGVVLSARVAMRRLHIR